MLIIGAAAPAGLLVTTAERRVMFSLIALAVFLMLTTVILIGRRHVAEQPMRMVYLSELEVATLVCVIVALLAATVNAVTWTSEHYDSIDLIRGVVLGFFSRDLFESGEDDSSACSPITDDHYAPT
jgi:hypothetical protein